MKLTALPCLCADVFDGTDEIRPGGEALNFAAHACAFENVDVTLLGVIGQDAYGQAILDAIADKRINTEHIRIDPAQTTANNYTYLTPEGERYYKPDSWNGEILENIRLTEEERGVIAGSDVVFIHFWASCFQEVLEMKKQHGFKLAVDFDVYRDFAHMEQLAPDIDFFMISGEEALLRHFRDFSTRWEGLFNMSLGAQGSVTYRHGVEYRVPAERVETVVDTTGCGDSYHAGFVCSWMKEGDIVKAMQAGSRIAAKTLSHYGGFRS
ncbi:MAG: carbohydrate kinase family protein [Clostridiales bacterium]|nr:carbohydrate kinase family protein [Clostridiales bacterium]